MKLFYIEIYDLLCAKVEQFTLENGMEYNINSKKYEADTVSLFDNYFAFLREKKIEEYQILKSL